MTKKLYLGTIQNSTKIHGFREEIGVLEERGAKKQYPKKAVHVKVAMKKEVPELAAVKKQHL